jgi:DNA-binding NarL/FixJ family response regulator
VLQHDQSAALLFKSIRTVAMGEYWVDRALVGKLARQVQFATTPFGLTARQRQVVSLLVAGYSNREIAERFKLSSNTVKHHLTSIFDKTGASTRVELAVFALHHGIAGSDPDHADTTGIEGIPRPRMARVQTPRLARDSRKQPA